MSSERLNKLEHLYSEHISAAVRVAYLLTGDQHLAQDIAQDAFVRVAGRFHGLRDPGAFPAYLRTTVVNLCRTHHRRSRTHRDYVAKTPPPQQTFSGPDIETQDEMWAALQNLPSRQRSALVLRYYEDLSERQIADALNTSESAVKSLLTRGLHQLRAQMRGES